MSDYKFTKAQLKWIEALESGKYKQGFWRLNADDKFCCLGVACDLFAKKLKLEVTEKPPSWSDEHRETWYGETRSVLPKELVEFLKLRNNVGMFDNFISRGKIKCGCLVDMNDIAGLSFKQIAKYMREHPENVFRNQGE